MLKSKFKVDRIAFLRAVSAVERVSNVGTHLLDTQIMHLVPNKLRLYGLGGKSSWVTAYAEMDIENLEEFPPHSITNYQVYGSKSSGGVVKSDTGFGVLITLIKSLSCSHVLFDVEYERISTRMLALTCRSFQRKLTSLSACNPWQW
jgi:hypothetical protein